MFACSLYEGWNFAFGLWGFSDRGLHVLYALSKLTVLGLSWFDLIEWQNWTLGSYGSR